MIETKIQVFKCGGKFFTSKIIKSFFEQLFDNLRNNRTLFIVSAINGATRLLRLAFIIRTEIKINENLKDSLVKLCLDEFKKNHIEIIDELFKDKENKNALADFNNLFNDLEKTINSYTEDDDPDVFYATVLQYGELVSSKIFSNYLNLIGLSNICFDAREYVVTTDDHKESDIIEVKNGFKKLFSDSQILITQGFIGRTASGLNSLVGFDGSDYSATQFANSIATSKEKIILTFWKDVDGVCTHNPMKNFNAKLIKELNRQEYVENVKKNDSFVVRPDSISSLNKNVEVNIRSFINLDIAGTKIFE